MEENKNVEKEMQESLDFGSKAISRSIERRRNMDSFQKIKDITQYLADLSFLLKISDLIETHGGKVTFTFNDYRDEKEKFEKMYGEYSNIKHSIAIATLEIKEKNLSELMELVDILDFNQKYSIFDLINDPGILSDEKERKLLVKYFGKAVWEKEGGKTC